jgi:hypothetical protein
MDIKSAYLNGAGGGYLHGTPSRFRIPEGMVMKLVKAVYGTKQGGHIWYEVRSKRPCDISAPRLTTQHSSAFGMMSYPSSHSMSMTSPWLTKV